MGIGSGRSGRIVARSAGPAGSPRSGQLRRGAQFPGDRLVREGADARNRETVFVAAPLDASDGMALAVLIAQGDRHARMETDPRPEQQPQPMGGAIEHLGSGL